MIVPEALEPESEPVRVCPNCAVPVMLAVPVIPAVVLMEQPRHAPAPQAMRFSSDTNSRAPAAPAAAFASCFAAKEAVIKALAATDGRGSFWHDIEILGDGGTPPAVVLSGRARALAAAAGIRRIHLSYDHTRDYAAACAVASR